MAVARSLRRLASARATRAPAATPGSKGSATRSAAKVARCACGSLQGRVQSWRACTHAQPGLPHPWGAITCREAAPLTTGGWGVYDAAARVNVQVQESNGGELSLEHLRDASTLEAKTTLQGLKGLGPKSVACILAFTLDRDDLAVDTHGAFRSLRFVRYTRG